MPVARIISTSFEDALKIAEYLTARFDTVEIAEPGRSYTGAVDLLVNLEVCTPEEALATVSKISEQPDVDIFIAPGTLVPVQEHSAEVGTDQAVTSPLLSPTVDTYAQVSGETEPIAESVAAQSFGSEAVVSSDAPAPKQRHVRLQDVLRKRLALLQAWLIGWWAQVKYEHEQWSARRSFLREVRQAQRQRQQELARQQREREEEVRRQTALAAEEQRLAALEQERAAQERERLRQEELERMRAAEVTASQKQEAEIREREFEQALLRAAEQITATQPEAELRDRIQTEQHSQAQDEYENVAAFTAQRAAEEQVPHETVAAAHLAPEPALLPEPTHRRARRILRLSRRRVSLHTRRGRAAATMAAATSVFVMLCWLAYANRRPASPVPASVLEQSGTAQQQAPFGAVVLPASGTSQSNMAVQSQAAVPERKAALPAQRKIRRVQIGDEEVEYLAEDVTVRHFNYGSGQPSHHSAAHNAVVHSSQKAVVKQISDMD
jgi:hypothetical protein